jgi:hypothetical protein
LGLVKELYCRYKYKTQSSILNWALSFIWVFV